MRRIAIALALLLAAAVAAGVARPEGARAVDAGPTTDSVTVGGTGTVASVPVRARLSLGVDTRGDTARAALAANASAMRKVIEAVKAAGGREVGTQSVGLSQAFGQNGEITGYAASNVVTTTIGIDRAGAVIDAAVEAGANQVSGPSPSIADQAALYREALQAAVADARGRAQTLAAAAGRTLGKVTSMSEGSAPPPLPLFQKAAAADTPGTPIEVGVQETTASVTVTFALGA
ncbi:pHypothetical Protein [Gaiella occulta]|uniref:DUF541 domain-containing protein n=1 Tax=Gaiella occulta TaxID=1002870 RepID=A0A7M2Z1K0_9ACTN|nr:SIMPL domain-containing protein [Gaiella occulta]RDI75644.1 pHypothetical Protein [Gaiella occulta]